MDRDRYYREKAAYKGPWKIPNVKDPRAPKKPMSAFLAFSNERRKIVAEANPNISNGEISGLLSKLWKEAPHDVKNQYREREAEERKKFKATLAEWEKQNSDAQLSIEEDMEDYEDSSFQNDGIFSSTETNNDDEDSKQPDTKMPPSQLKEDDTVVSLPPFHHPRHDSGINLTMFRQPFSVQRAAPNPNYFSMLGNVPSNSSNSLFPDLPTQQRFITLPPGPHHPQRHQTQPHESCPLAHADQTSGSPLDRQAAADRGTIQSDRAAVQASQNQTTMMDEYHSLDPFIETDTGGFLAAFAVLEKEEEHK